MTAETVPPSEEAAPDLSGLYAYGDERLLIVGVAVEQLELHPLWLSADIWYGYCNGGDGEVIAGDVKHRVLISQASLRQWEKIA